MKFFWVGSVANVLAFLVVPTAWLPHFSHCHTPCAVGPGSFCLCCGISRLTFVLQSLCHNSNVMPLQQDTFLKVMLLVSVTSKAIFFNIALLFSGFVWGYLCQKKKKYFYKSLSLKRAEIRDSCTVPVCVILPVIFRKRNLIDLLRLTVLTQQQGLG